MYSIQAAQYDNAPQSIRVAAALPFSQMEIQDRDSVWVSNGALHIGQIAIDLSFIVPWHPVLPDFPSGAVLQRLEQNINLVRQTIGCFGKSGGLRELWFDVHPGGKQGIYAVSLKERSTRMITALREQDIAGAYQAGCSLIGLGGGLTPSGDDFCAALLTVFNMPGSPFREEYRQLGEQLASAAQRQTTYISQEMLRLAARGLARENVGAFLKEVAGCSPDSLAGAAFKVMQAGCLSGTDWAVGLTAGLEVGKELVTIGK